MKIKIKYLYNNIVDVNILLRIDFNHSLMCFNCDDWLCLYKVKIITPLRMNHKLTEVFSDVYSDRKVFDSF